MSKTPQILEPYREHRWGIKSIAGVSNDAFVYAEKLKIPDFCTSKSKGHLMITFYDVPLRDSDVLQEMLYLVGRIGETVIERLDGEGKSEAQFIFYNSRIEKIYMPNFDYTSSAIARVRVKISYDSSWYKRILRRN